MKLGQILIRKKLISKAQLEYLLQIQERSAKRLGDLLLANGFVSDRDLNDALLEQHWRNKGFWVID